MFILHNCIPYWKRKLQNVCTVKIFVLHKEIHKREVFIKVHDLQVLWRIKYYYILQVSWWIVQILTLIRLGVLINNLGWQFQSRFNLPYINRCIFYIQSMPKNVWGLSKNNQWGWGRGFFRAKNNTKKTFCLVIYLICLE